MLHTDDLYTGCILVKEMIILTLVKIGREDFIQDFCNRREIRLNSKFRKDSWEFITVDQIEGINSV